MRSRFLFIFNGLVAFVTAVFLFNHFAHVPVSENTALNPPAPAEFTRPATDLAFVAYPDTVNGAATAVNTLAHPLDANGRANVNAQPRQLFSQPDPPSCQTDDAVAAPNGRFLILQYNCEANLFIRLLNLADETAPPIVLSRGYFLDWSPDGNWFLFRDIDTDQISLIAAADTTAPTPLDLPFGAYGATFTPDGQQITYVASRGLGLGSELGQLNLTDGSRTRQQQFPDQIIAYPRWSPDGTQLAYILMPDSNIPYTVGELWLADVTTGAPTTRVDEVDAGHGYPPAWSPDGSTIAYIRRQNPDSPQANHDPYALHSNIYQVEVAAGLVTQLTHFDESLVYDAAWSPDGSHLAFTANDAVWTLQPGQSPARVNPAGIARHPVWLIDATSE